MSRETAPAPAMGIEEKGDVVTPPEQPEAVEQLLQCLHNGDHASLLKLRQEGVIPDELFQIPEVQAAVLERLRDTVARKNADVAISLQENFPLPAEVLQVPELQGAVAGLIVMSHRLGRSPVAQRMQECFPVPDTQIHEAAVQYIALDVSRGHFNDALLLKQRLKLPEEVMHAPEIQGPVQLQVMAWLTQGSYRNAIDTKVRFNLLRENFQTPAIQAELKAVMLKAIMNGFDDIALEIMGSFELAEEAAESAAVEAMLKSLSNGYFDDVKNLREKFAISDATLQTPTVQAAAKEAMVEQISTGSIDTAKDIREIFSLPDSVAQVAAVEGMMEALTLGFYDDVANIKETFAIPDAALRTPETQEAAKRAMVQLVANDNANDAQLVRNTFSIAPHDVRAAVVEGITRAFTEGYYMPNVWDIQNELDLPDGFFKTPEIKAAALQGMIRKLSGGYPTDALKIQEKFALDRNAVQGMPEVRAAAQEGMAKLLSVGDATNAHRLAEVFAIPEADAQDAATKAIPTLLKHGDVMLAIEVGKLFNLPEATLQSPEIQAAAAKAMSTMMSSGYVARALSVVEGFKLPPEVLQTPDLQAQALKVVIDKINNRQLLDAQRLLGAFKFSEAAVADVAVPAMVRSLSQGYFADTLEVKRVLGIPNEVLQTSEMQAAAMKSLLLWIENARFDHVAKLIEEFAIPRETLQAPEVREKAKTSLVAYLNKRMTGSIGKIREMFGFAEAEIHAVGVQAMVHLLTLGHTEAAASIQRDLAIPAEALQIPEVQIAAMKAMLENLSLGLHANAVTISQHFAIPAEALQTPEIRSLATEAMQQQLVRGEVQSARAIKDTFILPDAEVRAAAVQSMVQLLSRGYYVDAYHVKEELNLPDELLQTPEVQAAVQQSLIELVRENSFDHVVGLKAKFGYPDELLQTPEVQAAAMQAVLHQLSQGYYSDGLEIFERMKFSEETLQAPDVQRTVERALRSCLLNGYFDDAKRLQQGFPIPEATVRAAAVQAVEKYLISSNPARALTVRRQYEIPDDVLLGAARQAIVHQLDRGLPLDAIEIQTTLGLPEAILQTSEIQDAAMRAMVESLTEGNAEGAQKLKAAFRLVDAAVQEIAQTQLIDAVTSNDVRLAVAIAKAFSFPGSHFKAPEVQERLKEYLEDHVRDADMETCKDLIAMHLIQDVDAFLKTPEMREAAHSGLISALSNSELEEARAIAELQEQYDTPDRDFQFGYDVFGDFLTFEIYETIQKIRNGQFTKAELKPLGISETGEAGLNQLRVQLVNFKSDITNPSFNPEVIKKSSLYKQYFASYVRFEGSEWGDSSDTAFFRTLETYEKLQREGKLAPLPKGYVESGALRVKKVDQEEQERFEYSEQFHSRYGTLQHSLRGALEVLEEPKPISLLVGRAEAKRTQLLETLRGKLQDQKNPKAVENLQKRIDQLEAVNMRDVRGFRENFATLTKFKEFDEELRQFIFLYALRKNRNYRDFARENATTDVTDFEDISKMINLVEHVVNQESWSKYFSNHDAAKAFTELTSVRALEEEYARAQNQSTKGTMRLDFVPTRGLLMEFSGQMADACWATKYKSIAQEFPNFTAVVMVQNRGTKHERVAGACMLIETESAQGEPLIVIRGLNPIENVINELKVEDFYKKFTEYGKTIAASRKRKLAIVNDESRGRAATNRQVLFNFLEKKRPSQKQVELKSAEESQFNGYDIRHTTYLV